VGTATSLPAHGVFRFRLGPPLANAHAPKPARTRTRVDGAVAASVNGLGSGTEFGDCDVCFRASKLIGGSGACHGFRRGCAGARPEKKSRDGKPRLLAIHTSRSIQMACQPALVFGIPDATSRGSTEWREGHSFRFAARRGLSAGARNASPETHAPIIPRCSIRPLRRPAPERLTTERQCVPACWGPIDAQCPGFVRRSTCILMCAASAAELARASARSKATRASSARPSCRRSAPRTPKK